MDEEHGEYLTTTQAAAIAGVTKQTIYIAAVRGRIPHHLSSDPAQRAHGGGQTILIRRADLETYMAERAARKARQEAGERLSGAERARRFYERKRQQRREGLDNG